MSQATIALTYDKLVNRIVPGPQSLSYFVPLVILPIAFSIPPWTASKQALCAVALPLITASLVHAWTVMGGIDVISFDMLLHSYHLLLFNDPRRHFRRILARPATAEKTRTPELGSRDGKDESTTLQYVEQAYPAKWSERLPWIGTLLISMRFVDWKIGSPSHDSRQPDRCPKPPSHSRFILIAILRTLSGYVVMDLTSAWTQQDPYFKTFGVSIDSPLPQHDLLGLLPPRLIRCTIMALQVWATVGQQFQLPCTLPVALHWMGYLPDAWSPHLWPTFFGSFRAMFSTSNLGAVRNFWGRYWHQTLRYYCSGPGMWLAGLLHLPRRSHSRYMLISATTFFFSGIVHIGLVPPDPMFAIKSANQIRWLILLFFWLQPVGFAFETAVSVGLRRMSTPKPIYTIMNILWFAAWCCFVLPFLGEAGRNLGYWRVWPVPISLWQGITLGKWLTWF
ncbi:hypothetical protein KCU95_g11022, partial [Aureobasidium melanogenum]